MFNKDFKQVLDDICEKTKNNSALNLNICLNYGGRSDITNAVNNLIKFGKKNISEQDILNNLYSKNQPELDMIIRTSGEMRLSNFMIYQGAYSELYFTKTLWPDFDERDLKKALISFTKRNRRYGG